MRTTQEEVELQKKRIIQKSIECFSTKGYKETLLSDISSALGITNGPLYYHFKNKLGLFCAATEAFLNAHIAEANRIFHADEDILDMLEKDFLYFFHKNTVDSGKYFLDINYVTQKSPHLNKVFTNYVETLWKIKYDAVAKAIERGELKTGTDPQEVTEIIFTLYEGLLYRYSVRLPGVLEVRTTDSVKALIGLIEAKYGA